MSSEDTKYKWVISVVLIVLTSLLIFPRLGHSALWDDEAATALFAKSVWRTGDTLAVLNHNIIAYDRGFELKGLRNRYMPPLTFYLTAPFLGLLGENAAAARLPFAICGLLTVVVIIRWLWRDGADLRTWLLVSLGILGNVSLMLYSRQCRYFALCMLLSTLIAYLYLHWQGRPRTLLLISLLSFALLASNYMNYLALYACLLVDYVLWRRKDRALRLSDYAVLLAPQVVLGGLLFYKYNLVIGEKLWNVSQPTALSQTLRLPWWYFRDLNSCEFGVGILIVAAPLLYFLSKDLWLLRAAVAIGVYILAIVVVGPQAEAAHTSVSTIRYLSPILPLCIAATVLAIRAMTARAAWLAVPLALVAFFSNVLHGGPLIDSWGPSMFVEFPQNRGFRSTLVRYVGELLHPPSSSYAATALWINQNVPPKHSVWTLPRYGTYPLMFHAPAAVYGWQLNYPPSPQFRDLPAIHFIGRELPEYIIAFGPHQEWVRGVLKKWETMGIRYQRVALIPKYYYDLTRPELFWHAFSDVSRFNPDTLETLCIYVFKLVSQPVRLPTLTSPPS